jgi:uncharacterized protein (DUF58 family)
VSWALNLTHLRRRFRRWATRSRVPEASPIRLAQRRVYVLPTRAGLALLATLLVMLLASINYNLSLGYALVFLLGSVFVAHILFSWRTLVDLELSLQPGEEQFAGSTATWQLSLHNIQRHERPAIRMLDSEGQFLLQTDVPAHALIAQKIGLPAPQRGLQQPGQLTLESCQPLGWIRAWAYIEPDAPALIYPAPAGELPWPEASSTQHAGPQGERAGQDDFAGLRGFQPGDSPRHIAWKQLAQGRGLMTKQFSANTAPECVLDWAALPAGLPVEARLSQLTAWVLQARQQGARSTLRLPGSETGPGADPAHHQACLLRLALFPGGRST